MGYFDVIFDSDVFSSITPKISDADKLQMGGVSYEIQRKN